MSAYVVYQVAHDSVDRETYLGIACDYYDAEWADRCKTVWDDGLYVAAMKLGG